MRKKYPTLCILGPVFHPQVSGEPLEISIRMTLPLQSIFWNMSNWEEFGCQGIEWELEWAKSYVAHGHGIECAVDTVENLSDYVKTFRRVAKLGGRKSHDFLNWVGTMSKKVSNVAEDLKNRRSTSMDDGIIS